MDISLETNYFASISELFHGLQGLYVCPRSSSFTVSSLSGLVSRRPDAVLLPAYCICSATTTDRWGGREASWKDRVR